MEIVVTRERIFRLVPRIDLAGARAKVEEKRVSLVAGTMGAFFSRPNPEEIRLISSEHRLEPIWHIRVEARTTYDRNSTYSVPVTGPEVKRVTALGQTLPVTSHAKGGVQTGRAVRPGCGCCGISDPRSRHRHEGGKGGRRPEAGIRHPERYSHHLQKRSPRPGSSRGARGSGVILWLHTPGFHPCSS
jgi:hypothetical protein